MADEDAYTLNRFNSFYSKDILSKLVGEPIRGNCFFWSSYASPFVISLRVEDFQDLYKGNVRPESGLEALETYAKRLTEDLAKKIDDLYLRFREEVTIRKLMQDFVETNDRNRYNQQPQPQKVRGFLEKDLLEALRSVIKDEDFVFELEESLLVRLISKNNPNFYIKETPEGTAYCFPS